MSELTWLQFLQSHCTDREILTRAHSISKLDYARRSHSSLDTKNVHCTLSLLPVLNIERHQITLFKDATKTGPLDIASLEENVFTTFSSHEAISLRFIEKLDCTLYGGLLSCRISEKQKAPAQLLGPVDADDDRNYAFVTLSACRPFGPRSTSN